MIRRRLSKIFYCPFWGHAPDEQTSWWVDGSDVVTLEATERRCGRCGETMNVDA